MVHDVERPWTPLNPTQTCELLADLSCRWWIAGGWAIDLHLGTQTREHGDMDVVVLRDDALAVQRHLDGWVLAAADPPGTLRQWLAGEHLPEHVHDIWCRPQQLEGWALQLMLIDPEGDEWVYRRNRAVRRPLEQISGPACTAALHVLAPEIQLLYKSHRPRPKDHQDFESMADHLSVGQRDWLRAALLASDPEHPWLSRL